MSTHGNYARIFVKGVEFDSQGNEVNWQPSYKGNPLLSQNIGVRQDAPGYQTNNLDLTGYKRTGFGEFNAHALLSQSGVGSIADIEFISTVALGYKVFTVPGDYAVMFAGTLDKYERKTSKDGYQTFAASFRSRARRTPVLGTLLHIGDITVASTTTVGISVGVGTNGAVAQLQVYKATGTKATGTLSASGIPSNLDNFVVTIGGVVYTYTFKTAIAAVGDVLIGASAIASMRNLYYAMVGSPPGLTTASYFPGTVPIPQMINDALVFITNPDNSAVITLTAKNNGAAANAYTLVKTGTNLVVSGATMAGGAAGETVTVLVQTATTQGGSYTTVATFVLDGTVQDAERIEIVSSTVLSQWARISVTKSAALQTIGLNVAYGPFWHAR